MVSWAALSLPSPFSILVPLWPKGCNELAVVNSGADLSAVSDALCLGIVLGPPPGTDSSRCEGVPHLYLLAALLPAHEWAPCSNTSLLLEHLRISAGSRGPCVFVGAEAVKRTQGRAGNSCIPKTRSARPSCPRTFLQCPGTSLLSRIPSGLGQATHDCTSTSLLMHKLDFTPWTLSRDGTSSHRLPSAIHGEGGGEGRVGNAARQRQQARCDGSCLSSVQEIPGTGVRDCFYFLSGVNSAFNLFFAAIRAGEKKKKNSES